MPTLVIQARQAKICPLSEGVQLASKIPDSRFVQLESRNHILLEHEPARGLFKQKVLEFVGMPTAAGKEEQMSTPLSPRERDILVGFAQGDADQAIALAKDGNLDCGGRRELTVRRAPAAGFLLRYRRLATSVATMSSAALCRFASVLSRTSASFAA